MGFFANWVSRWATGKSADQLQADSDAADAKRAELNQRKLDNGSWSKAQYDEAEANRLAGYYDATAQINSAAIEGAKEGLAAEKAWVSNTGTSVIKEALSWVPWWAWVGLALYVLWQLGWLAKGLNKLRA